MLRSQEISKWFRNLQHSKKLSWISYVLLGAMLFFALMNNVKPEQLDVDMYSIAKKTIHSPIKIEDKVITERKKQEAAQKVGDQYTYRSEYKQNRVDIVNDVFAKVNEVIQEMKAAGPEEQKKMTDANKLEKLKKKLPSNLTKELSDENLLYFINAEPDQLELAKNAALTSVSVIMGGNIKMSEEMAAKERFVNEMKSLNVNSGLKEAVNALGSYAITANYFYDPAVTKEKKKAEEDLVPPVYILQGQVIVREGETISSDMYNQLKLVGLLEKGNSFQPYVGLAVLIGVLLYFMHKQFEVFLQRKREDKPYILAYITILSITIVLMKIISLFQKLEYAGIAYVVPVAMGTILVKLMIGDRFVFLTSMIFSVCGSIMFNEGVTSTLNYSVGIYVLLSSLSVSIFLREKNRRTMILQAGILVSILNVVVLAALLLLRNGNFSPLGIGTQLLMASLSGIISSVLAMGILPYLESGLGIVSSMKLMELSSPNHPLLRRILLEAPGTYHHSVMVANLSEAACEAVGANGVLARVGAYYHDVGKTVQPQFFIENQMGIENPHDKLDPVTSKDIIIAHVTDGVKMLEEYHIPQEIIDIAGQHHGTTLLKYFYYKAIKEDKEKYTEEMFRYPGSKATSKESAIVGIADSVEAAVRSMNHPTPDQINNLVQSIIKDRLQDGQFSECDLTFKELQIVGKTLCETLNGIFHSRITYPEPPEDKEKE
ncbi:MULTISPECIES: HD family phosphohydrolase [Bacillus cereus group]|uniref:HD family phosphohydrolase n=1 Tax=Bacillus cereus group TaxID=86661 RepID=UPI0022E06BA0|nr:MULTISPECIES: HD family phosphohydrolase [Bacillus cereus group]MDA2662692.1 HD family phosphohydrolase [Bacillus cereus group sp. Bc032]MDA2673415.1 HD family phosphohydrolase [Bacillus cereus group sp. Bc031]MDA2678823.1 HD family phosphohydrolase [Bacillus cereus group sp. Bc029]MDA2684332.1 HD family phosphohydrolase [Bacillus cereus group sp. Bc030]MDA2739808.1 HD family phosphohydrolase [Bacillus cereus group sp. Bc011]